MKSMIDLTAVLLAIFLMTSVSFAEAQQVIFLVRHGDTVRQQGNPDVPLSDAGERRAVALAALLKESGITAIYTTGASSAMWRGKHRHRAPTRRRKI